VTGRLTHRPADPEGWEQPLRAELAATAAGTDPELVKAAQALVNLVDRAGVTVRTAPPA
jgi:hypothetical protein